MLGIFLVPKRYSHQQQHTDPNLSEPIHLFGGYAPLIHSRSAWVLLILLVVSGCSTKPAVVTSPETYSGVGKHQVFVVNHGWHTGFVIPSTAIYSHLPALALRFGTTAKIEFGWGDKGFYQAKKITSGLAIRAIFSPTESVIHAVAVPIDVASYFPHSQIEMLCLSDQGLSSLVTFIAKSFRTNEQGEIVQLRRKDKTNLPLAERSRSQFPSTSLRERGSSGIFVLANHLRNGIYGDSQFYQGIGNYYLLNTCNKWTAKGLKSAGLALSPTFKLTANSVMHALVETNRSLPLSCAIP